MTNSITYWWRTSFFLMEFFCIFFTKKIDIQPPHYDFRLQVLSNSLGTDIALGFKAMMSTNDLGLLLPIAICVNLWMPGFNVWWSWITFFSIVFCCTSSPFVRVFSKLHHPFHFWEFICNHLLSTRLKV